MKILHFSTQDIGGGAFDAAYRLHQNLLLNGHESSMVVLRKLSNDERVVDFSLALGARARVLEVLAKIIKRLKIFLYKPGYYFRFYDEKIYSSKSLVDSFQFTPEIIIFHWTSNFICLKNIKEIFDIVDVPMYWYMMDMSPITGGCDYAFDCNGYKFDCSNCPQVGNGKSNCSIAQNQLANKANLLKEVDISIIAASSWTLNQVQASSLFSKKRRFLIPLGINSSSFRENSRESARKLLRLPKDKKIIFFGANNIDEERKGFKYFIDGIKKLAPMLIEAGVSADEILVVTAGRVIDSYKLNFQFKSLHLGILHGDLLIAAYQAADIFVCTSIEDSGPMMINESISFGTPVVSFDMGVASDFLNSGNAGYLVKLGDSEDLAKGMLKLITMDSLSYSKIRENCREIGLKISHPSVQVSSIISLARVRA